MDANSTRQSAESSAVAAKLLKEVCDAHADPQSPDWNDCGPPEKDCEWCRVAKGWISEQGNEKSKLDYLQLLTEVIKLHDTISTMDIMSHWSGCKCDHGCDGRAPRQGPECERCQAASRIQEIKHLIDFDRPEREAAMRAASLDSAQL